SVVLVMPAIPARHAVQARQELIPPIVANGHHLQVRATQCRYLPIFEIVNPSLFRKGLERRLLVVMLVGETPTWGLHSEALRKALDEVTSYPEWTHSDGSIRILSPTFSGTASSLG